MRSLPPDVRAEPLGTMRLRGKQEGIDLFALSRPLDNVAQTRPGAADG
jgi:hypothetical protein